jgi:hypothetical protein
MGGDGPWRNQANRGYSLETIVEMSSLALILLAVTVFAFFFRRRRA